VIFPLMEIEIGMAMEIIFGHEWKVRMGNILKWN
jgi:hypothetical protein